MTKVIAYYILSIYCCVRAFITIAFVFHATAVGAKHEVKLLLYTDKRL